MKVFLTINEAHPLYKIGGLGDVGGSLPKALKDLGIDISIVLPKHPQINIQGFNEKSPPFKIIYNNETLEVIVHKGLLPNTLVPVYLVDEEKYISTKTDASDNHADKYSVFSLAVSHWINSMSDENKPNIVHLNDWHTAMIPVISTHMFNEKNMKYIVSIHNLMYQGVTKTPILSSLGLSPNSCQILSNDIKDEHINMLLEGMLHADIISTVSPNYASEILTTEYGEKIDKVLSLRKKDILGILNGLDLDAFDPNTDKHIYKKYSPISVIEGKKENKDKIQKELGLEQDENKILVGFVGRVDAGQKGVQLIIEAIEKNILIKENQQFIFLGVGDSDLERKLHQVSSSRLNIKVITRYDEGLAAKIYAASDLLLIPSKFEPCGLIQMIAMRYGTLPVARSTGGLKDTIDDQKDGFLFSDYSVDAMVSALQNSIRVISDHQTRHHMIQSAMSKDFSWDESAIKYKQTYERLLQY